MIAAIADNLSGEAGTTALIMGNGGAAVSSAMCGISRVVGRTGEGF
jgi:hypothetical protein